MKIYIIILSLLFAQVSVASRPVSVIQGESVELFNLDNSNIKSAMLFYRLEGSKNYLQQPLIKQGGHWVSRLLSAQLRPPGIEYYAQIILKNGQQLSQPDQHPRYNPLRLKVRQKQGVNLKLQETQILQNQDVFFKVLGYVDSETRVFIDDIDVTEFVTRQDQDWVFNNEGQLFSGDQVLSLQSIQGQTLASYPIKFIDSFLSQVKNRQLVIKGNTSFNIGGQADSTDTKSNVALSANMHVEAEYKQGEFSARYSGIDVNYQHGAEEPVNLSAGVLLQNKYKNHSLDIGDVSVSGTPLVLSGFSRRGFVASTSNDQYSGSFFNVRTSTVDGFESGISFDDRQTYGATVDTKLGQSSVQVSVISGELKDDNAGNVGSTDNKGQAGDSVGVAFTTELAGTSINAEIANSSFDADTSDNQAKQNDSAYEISLSRDIVGLASTLGYHHYGANYATIANPNFSNDREGLNLSLGSGWRFLNWSVSLSTTTDNVEEDAARAIVKSNNTGLNLGFVVENWPSINVGFNVSNQKSSQEPSLNDRIDNDGQYISLGLSDNFGDYNVSWTSSFGLLRNNLDVTNDSDTTNHVLSVGFNIDATNIDVSLSQNKTESNITLISNLANMSLNFPLFNDTITLNSQFSVQDNTSSDSSQNNTIAGASANVSWAMKDMVSGVTAFWADTQFSLSWSYSKTEDTINSGNDSSDNVVMLTFNLGAPSNFEVDWQF